MPWRVDEQGRQRIAVRIEIVGQNTEVGVDRERFSRPRRVRVVDDHRGVFLRADFDGDGGHVRQLLPVVDAVREAIEANEVRQGGVDKGAVDGQFERSAGDVVDQQGG